MTDEREERLISKLYLAGVEVRRLEALVAAKNDRLAEADAEVERIRRERNKAVRERNEAMGEASEEQRARVIAEHEIERLRGELIERAEATLPIPPFCDHCAPTVVYPCDQCQSGDSPSNDCDQCPICCGCVAIAEVKP